MPNETTGGTTPPLDPVTGKESSLTTYAGDYVTDMMGKGQALADQPYEAYTGPLTAGESDLQTDAFEGIGGLSVPTGAMGGMTADSLGSYMNPYLQNALQPQVDAARREADIQRLKDASRLTKSGAYGGSRQAVMEAEGNRALGDRLAGIYGTGYKDAFDSAAGLFSGDRAYGLEALQMQADAGAAQRAIEAEGIAADKTQFEEEYDDPYKKLQYMQSLLQGLPLESQDYVTMGGNPIVDSTRDAGGIYDLINKLLGGK